MDMITASRRWIVEGEGGRHEFMVVHYKIYLKNGRIADIRNELGFSVEKGSDCWDYFTRRARHI